MKFRDLCAKVDLLFPSMFSNDEKMSFADELSAFLHSQYLTSLKRVSVNYPAEKLPGYITQDIIKCIYKGNIPLVGTSFDEVTEKNGEGKYEVEFLVIPRYNLDSELPVSPPFDKLYLYFILAKICLHTDDIDGYNNYTILYNQFLSDFEKQLSKNSNKSYNFTNLW